MGSSRHVVWDERNLQENEEYQRLHPVTMHIDEPKTPYVYGGELSDDELEEDDGRWDPSVNQYAKEVKEKVLSEHACTTVAPVSAGGRPMLAPGTLTGELENERAEKEFKQIRKAVYADEGAAFKAMLAKQSHPEDEDEDEDEDDSDGDEEEEEKEGDDEEEEDDDARSSDDNGGYELNC